MVEDKAPFLCVSHIDHWIACTTISLNGCGSFEQIQLDLEAKMELKGIFRLPVSVSVSNQLSASTVEKRSQSEVTAQHPSSTSTFLSLTLQK